MAEKTLISERYEFRDDGCPTGLTESQSRARKVFLDEVHKKTRYIRLAACPYCGNGQFSVISEVERRGLPSDVAVCEACGGCFKASILDPDAAIFHYNNVSYTLRGKDAAAKAMNTLFHERVRRFAYPKYYFISHFLELKPDKDFIVELGCNDGANLYPWKENGFKAAGIDLDDHSAEFGRKLGLDIRSGDFMVNNPSYGKPALVIMSHLLEHVTDAGLALDRVRQMIEPDGYLFIESPGIRVHGLRNTMAYFDVEHNYNFDKESLMRLLEERSFRVIYADEYVRFICTPRENGKVQPLRRIQLSLDIVIAVILRSLIKLIDTRGMKLTDILKRSERNSLRIMMLNKFQGEYFKRYYSAIVHSGEKC